MITILAGLLSVGQAQASDQKNTTEVKALVQKQTGYDPVSMNQDDLQKEMETLLNQPLTEDAAIKIAILNSPLVKAELSALGISEADMREAGILHNPTVQFTSRRSNEAGSKRDDEIEIKQDVLDILFWPLRKSAAGTRFKAVQYESAHKITEFIKGVRLSYLEWLAAMHKKSLAQDYYKSQEAALEISHRQKEAGNINTLQMDAVQVIFQRAKIEWLKTQQDTQTAAERLRTVLALKQDQSFLDETKRIPDLPRDNLDLKELEKQALDHRLDLLMKRQDIKALEQYSNLADLGVLPEVHVGYDQEREASGNKLKGVVVEGQVPLFNRNQAGQMGAKAAIETAKHQLDAMQGQALLEVRLAYQSLTTNRQIVESYQIQVPLYQQMIKERLHQYNFMLTDVFRVLEAKQEELKTQKEYVDALKDYWASRAELEYATGLILPSGS